MARELASRRDHRQRRRARADRDRDDRRLARGPANGVSERHPAGRLGTVDEVADLVAFLARREAGYITGQVIGINGGLYM